MAEDEKEGVFTSAQLAQELGCSIQSIYKWEKDGVIPKADRVGLGVGARLYTQREFDQIRQIVHRRIRFVAASRVQFRKSAGVPRTFNELMAYDWSPIFQKAIASAKQCGCRSLTMVTDGGDVKVFSL